MWPRQGFLVRRSLALAFGLAVWLALPAMAQQQIPIGTSVSGQLTAADPTLSDGSHYKLFNFMGTAGQTVQIDLMSSDFDSYLSLRNQTGSSIAHDDDGGGGLNSRIIQQLPYSGMYQIVVNTLRSGQFGSFTLQLQATGMAQPVAQPLPTQPVVTALPSNVVGSIGLNQQVQNTLVPGAATFEGKPIQSYNFNCTAGQAFQMDVLSSWDNYAMVFDPAGNVVARDDDTGEGLNARIQYTCAVSGTYRLAVTTFASSTTTGPYTMQVQGLGQGVTTQPQPQPITQPVVTPLAAPAAPSNAIPAPGQTAQIVIGQTMRGRLEDGDQTMQDGTFADLWQFQGTAGQTVTIDVRSDEFDTYIQLLDAGGNKLAEDDDSGGNLNSHLSFQLPATAMYQLVVNNAGQSRRSGQYTISVR
jgi:hypothetical protein